MSIDATCPVSTPVADVDVSGPVADVDLSSVFLRWATAEPVVDRLPLVENDTWDPNKRKGWPDPTRKTKWLNEDDKTWRDVPRQPRRPNHSQSDVDYETLAERGPDAVLDAADSANSGMQLGASERSGVSLPGR